MQKHILMAGVCSLMICGAMSQAIAHEKHEADDHAPIGVMGDHNHHKGEWMLSYRYSHMEMKGNRDGDSKRTTAQVLNDFMVAPLDMSMDMHMVGVMYGATNKLTLMGMVPYMQKTMHLQHRNGKFFRTHSEGLGDIKLTGLYTLYDSGVDEDLGRMRHKLLLSAGASLPTGSITQRADTVMGANQKLPYPMQLGSGTVDPIFGLTYTNKFDDWSWGAQGRTTLRFGQNNEGYRLGNEYGVTTWVAKNLCDFASASFRLDGSAWGNINGKDNELNASIMPTARTDLRGGERIDAIAGLNLYQTHGKLAGNRLALEFGMPVYQSLQGPQLETDYNLTLGWQWAF